MESEKIVIKKFPREIAIGLIVLSVAASLAPIFLPANGVLLAIVMNVVIIFIVAPLAFVSVGLIQKIRDRTFNLWNMYYLGMLVGIFFSLQKLGG